MVFRDIYIIAISGKDKELLLANGRSFFISTRKQMGRPASVNDQLTGWLFIIKNRLNITNKNFDKVFLVR